MPYIVPEAEAQRELETGEALLWSGRPDAGMIGRQAWPLLIFAIPWTGFAVFWMATAFSTGSHAGAPSAASVAFPLFGLPFVLIGVALLCSPLWMARMAQATVYAVTNRRILIITASGNRTVKSFGPSDLGGLEFTSRPDGSGTLTFARHVTSSSNGAANVIRDQFVGIPDVRSVEKLIRDNLMPDQPGGQGWTR